MSRFVAPIIAVLILIPVLIIGLTRDPSKLPSPYLGKEAPAIDSPSLTRPDQRLTSEDFAGKTVLVNIWATWCVGCRQEHGFLMNLADKNAVPIYSINWRDNRSEALRWLQQLGDPYVDTAFDEDGRVGIDWGAYGAPETFLVNADGIVVHKHLGPLNEVVWQRDFEPLLAAEVATQ